MSIMQIGILGVTGTILALQFKSGKSEYGIYISIVLSIFIFFGIIDRLKVMIDTVKKISDYISIDSAYISIFLKMLGITYIAEFSSGICKDAGYQTVAQQIEIFGKLSVLALSMPILLALLDTIKGFLS